MRWEDEQFVKVYTRDTGEWLALGWEAQALFLLMLRKADRAGLVHAGRARVRGLAGMTGMPVDVVGRALAVLVDDGCVRECDGGYLIPSFVAAQEARQTDRARKALQRQKDRDIAATAGVTQPMVADMMAVSERAESHAVTPAVTSGHTSSHVVTLRLDETRSDEIRSASQGTASPSREPEGFALAPTPATKSRKPSAAQVLYENLQEQRRERCEEVGEPFVPDHWPVARQNGALGPLAKGTPEEQALFSDAWACYLADDGARAKTPAWSLGWFMASGVRARYETEAARAQNEGEAA